jgi:hypothetical protein
MRYNLKVSDNNGINIYGPFSTLRDATKERTSIIQSYGYNKGKGFTRESYKNTVVFHHAVYSTVVFDVVAA